MRYDMVDLGPWLNVLTKIGLGIGAVFVGYLVSKVVAGFLVSVFVWARPVRNTPSVSADADEVEEQGESMYAIPGLHVISGFGAEHTIVDENPTEQSIQRTIEGLDWLDDFHQVMLVTPSGAWFEVSGSLDPEYGLSSAYGDSRKGGFKVINEAPTSVAYLKDLMLSYFRGDGRWASRSEYDYA